MSLPDKVEWWLLRAKKMVAAEVKALTPDSRAWVGVYPITYPSLLHNTDGNYCVRHFEVTNLTLDLTVNVDKYIDERDFKINEIVYVKDKEELEETLIKWLEDMDQLVLPFSCQYPL